MLAIFPYSFEKLTFTFYVVTLLPTAGKATEEEKNENVEWNRETVLQTMKCIQSKILRITFFLATQTKNSI